MPSRVRSPFHTSISLTRYRYRQIEIPDFVGAILRIYRIDVKADGDGSQLQLQSEKLSTVVYYSALAYSHLFISPQISVK